MADGNASVPSQSLTLVQPRVNAHWIAVKTAAFELPDHKIQFASVAPVVYRRTLAVPKDALGLTNREIGMATAVTHYRRNLATPSPTAHIIHSAQMAIAITVPPRRLRVVTPAALIDVRVAPGGIGSHTYTGTRPSPVTKLPVTMTFVYTETSEVLFDIPETLPDRPHLLWPLYGTNHRTATPLMRWTAVADAEFYEVHVAHDINFLNRVARFDTLLTELLRGLPFGDAFYWRVRAVGESGAYSPFSEVWYFTTSPITPTQESGHAAAARARLLWQFQENADA